MNYTDYKDARDFCNKNKMTPREAMAFLDSELQKIHINMIDEIKKIK